MCSRPALKHKGSKHVQVKLWNRIEKKKTESGDMVTLYTHDPEKCPLLAWDLSRIAKLAGVV